MVDPVDLLADPAAVRAADRAALLPAAATAGAQVRATCPAVEAALPASAEFRPRAMLVIADGRAVADALIFAALVGPECPVPVLVRADLPAWVGALDVVVVLESGSPTEAAAAAVAQRRGALVLVRGAARGVLAEAVPAALLSPSIGVPEALAGPGRLAFLLAVAAGLQLVRPSLTETDVETVADLLDTEAIACAPQTDAFVNPAVSLAQPLVGGDLVVAGADAIGRALAGHAAVALAELGGAVASGFGATELVQAAGLMNRLGRRRDIFADPFDDPTADHTPIVPVVLRALRPTDERLARVSSTWLRSIQSALPAAILLDGPELSLAPTDTGLPDRPVRPEPTGWVKDWACTALMMLRLDFAAVYVGIAAGQVPPTDSPAGLGPHDGARRLLDPDTVLPSYRDEEDVERWN